MSSHPWRQELTSSRGEAGLAATGSLAGPTQECGLNHGVNRGPESIDSKQEHARMGYQDQRAGALDQGSGAPVGSPSHEKVGSDGKVTLGVKSTGPVPWRDRRASSWEQPLCPPPGSSPWELQEDWMHALSAAVALPPHFVTLGSCHLCLHFLIVEWAY